MTTSKRLPCSWQLELQLWSVCLPLYGIAWGNLGQKPGRASKKGHPSCTLSSTQTLPPPYGLCQNFVRTSQGVFIQNFLCVRLILLLFNGHEMSIMEELGGKAKRKYTKEGGDESQSISDLALPNAWRHPTTQKAEYHGPAGPYLAANL